MIFYQLLSFIKIHTIYDNEDFNTNTGSLGRSQNFLFFSILFEKTQVLMKIYPLRINTLKFF